MPPKLKGKEVTPREPSSHSRTLNPILSDPNNAAANQILPSLLKVRISLSAEAKKTSDTGATSSKWKCSPSIEEVVDDKIILLSLQAK